MQCFWFYPIAGVVLGTLAAGSAASTAAGDVLFDCTIGAKQLLVALQGDIATYSFGPKGAPELTISAAPRDLNYLPWNGWGIEMPEAVQFLNEGTIYEVWYSVQKLIDDNSPLPPTQGGVRVITGDKMLADLVCNAAPSVYDLERIYDAKLAARQCYDWESQSWGTACAG